MGAQSSSAALERAMEFTLQGIPNYRAYCGDVIVFTKDYDSHLDILGRMFQACSKHGIRFKPAKVKTLFTTINWLGFQTCPKGISPEKEKWDEIGGMEIPSTVKEIRQAGGLFSFFRRFIKNFSRFSGKLTSLTKSGRRQLPVGALRTRSRSYRSSLSYVSSPPKVWSPLVD